MGIFEELSAAGMEIPTTEEVGKVFWNLDEALVSVGRRRDAHDLRGVFGAKADIDATGVWEVADGAGISGPSTAVAFSSDFGGVTVSTCGDCGGADNDLPLLGEAAVIDNEVFVDKGDPGIGVSGAVEQAGVVSVVVDDRTSVRSGDEGTEPFKLSSTGNSSTTEGEGDTGGVDISMAFWMTSCGGRARGEMMMPGACEGSSGRRDQMTHPPLNLSDVARAGEET